MKRLETDKGEELILEPLQEVNIPINFRASIKGQFSVRFLFRYQVQFKSGTDESKVPAICKYRFQRMMIFINSNLGFNMNPVVHMSAKQPDQYLINLQTTQKLKSTWYERP